MHKICWGQNEEIHLYFLAFLKFSANIKHWLQLISKVFISHSCNPLPLVKIGCSVFCFLGYCFIQLIPVSQLTGNSMRWNLDDDVHGLQINVSIFLMNDTTGLIVKISGFQFVLFYILWISCILDNTISISEWLLTKNWRSNHYFFLCACVCACVSLCFDDCTPTRNAIPWNKEHNMTLLILCLSDQTMMALSYMSFLWSKRW